MCLPVAHQVPKTSWSGNDNLQQRDAEEATKHVQRAYQEATKHTQRACQEAVQIACQEAFRRVCQEAFNMFN